MPEVNAGIRARNVTKRFGPFTAVDSVSLAVKPGEIVGLLGANGAGKTTLIRAILGLVDIDGGMIGVFGQAPSRTTRARLGYMPQGLGLYRELSVQENVAFTAQAFKLTELPPLPPALEPLRARPVGEIGLGHQRQLAFYCALAHRPELLILDEPTSGVDPLTRARLWDTIHERAAAGVGVLVTTHYMQEAEQCSRLELLAAGRTEASGTVADIVGDARAVIVRSDSWERAFSILSDAGLPVSLQGRAIRVAGSDPGAVRAALSAAGDATAEVSVEPATLEEVMVLIATRGQANAPSKPDPGPR